MTVAADSTPTQYPAMITWVADGATRLEGTRVQLGARGLKAAGRVVGAACDEHPAFSASYDLLLDEEGVTRRLSMRSIVAGGERQVSLTRNAEGFWLVDHGQGARRGEFGGALDVDVVRSPFFNALTVRRLGLHTEPDDVSVAVVYVSMPELTVTGETHRYAARTDAITVTTPQGVTDITVDADGFVLDYPGLAHRV